MITVSPNRLVNSLGDTLQPLTGARGDYDPLLKSIGSCRFVLLGEATHGTHEFYKARSEITKRLIREKGFNVIAWEADWPDALRINRYIQNRSQDQTALESLENFKRFPRWMWRNTDILDLIGWLRSPNQSLPSRAPKVGVYGLDLYILYPSIEAVISYLVKADPEAAPSARPRSASFDDFCQDTQTH